MLRSWVERKSYGKLSSHEDQIEHRQGLRGTVVTVVMPQIITTNQYAISAMGDGQRDGTVPCAAAVLNCTVLLLCSIVLYFSLAKLCLIVLYLSLAKLCCPVLLSCLIV